MPHLELQPLVINARHQGGVASADGRHDAAVWLLACGGAVGGLGSPTAWRGVTLRCPATGLCPPPNSLLLQPACGAAGGGDSLMSAGPRWHISGSRHSPSVSNTVKLGPKSQNTEPNTPAVRAQTKGMAPPARPAQASLSTCASCWLLEVHTTTWRAQAGGGGGGEGGVGHGEWRRECCRCGAARKIDGHAVARSPAQGHAHPALGASQMRGSLCRT